MINRPLFGPEVTDAELLKKLEELRYVAQLTATAPPFNVDMTPGGMLHWPDLETVEIVRIRSTVPNADGYYDAVIQKYNYALRQWQDTEEIWVLDANS